MDEGCGVNKFVIGITGVVVLLLVLAAVRHSHLPGIDTSKTVDQALRSGRYKRRLSIHDESKEYETPVQSVSGRTPKFDRSAADVAVENR